MKIYMVSLLHRATIMNLSDTEPALQAPASCGPVGTPSLMHVHTVPIARQ